MQVAQVAQVAVMLVVPALAVLGGRHPRARSWLSPIVVTYLLGLLLGNLAPAGWLDPKLTELVVSLSVALGIPLLLFTVDLRGWLRLAPATAISAGLGFASVTVATLVTALWFAPRLDDGWKVAGMLAGTFTGSGPNLAAVGAALEARPETMTLVVTADFLLAGLYCFALLTPAVKVFARFFPGEHEGDRRETTPPRSTPGSGGDKGGNPSQDGPKEPDSPGAPEGGLRLTQLPSPAKHRHRQQHTEGRNSYQAQSGGPWGAEPPKNHIRPPANLVLQASLALALALAIAAFAGWLGSLAGSWEQLVAVLTVTTLGLVAAAVPRVRALRGSFALGEYWIMVFCLGFGSLADVSRLLESGASLPVAAWTSLVIVIAVPLHVLTARMFRIDWETVVVTSAAAFAGPAIIAPVVANLRRPELLLSGVTAALVGLAGGTYLGILVAAGVKAFTG